MYYGRYLVRRAVRQENAVDWRGAVILAKGIIVYLAAIAMIERLVP